MKMKKFTYLSGFLFSLAMVIGVFFQLMHLPGAKILMFTGGIGIHINAIATNRQI